MTAPNVRRARQDSRLHIRIAAAEVVALRRAAAAKRTTTSAYVRAAIGGAVVADGVARAMREERAADQRGRA